MFSFYAKAKFVKELRALRCVLYRLQDEKKQRDTCSARLESWPQCGLQGHGEFSRVNKRGIEALLATCDYNIERDEAALQDHREEFLKCLSEVRGGEPASIPRRHPVASFN